MKKTLKWVAGAAALALTVTACGGGSGGSSDGAAASVGGAAAATASGTASGTVNYWLWDANQLPAYQACADAFHAANPNITVKITQYDWNDYWTKINNGFTSGTGPDVFTDHLSKYPEFVNKQQILLDQRRPRGGQGQHRHLPARSALAMESAGRKDLRAAQGLRHRRPLLQRGHGHLGRLHPEHPWPSSPGTPPTAAPSRRPSPT